MSLLLLLSGGPSTVDPEPEPETIDMAKIRLTAAFRRIFDAIRPVSRVNPDDPVIFLDKDGEPIGYQIVRGYMMTLVSDGTGSSDKEFMLQFTDREGIDDNIYAARRFDIGDTRYERVGGPSSPATNPAIWKILIKPIKRRIV